MNSAGARAIAFLRSPIATLAVLVTALVAQLPHAADVFRLAVSGEGLGATLHSYSYAVALELAVLLFVVQRRNVESYLFAFASICINLAYYALHGVNLASIDAAPAWLISVALPVAIARYSHGLVDAAHDAASAQPAQSARVQTEPVEDAPRILDARTTALQMHTEGFGIAQIATDLGANPSTVRSWIRRAQQERA
jgi:hypothetical protein